MHDDVALTQTIRLEGLGLTLQRLADQMDDIASRLARIEQRQIRLERAINRNTINDIITTEATMSVLDDLETRAQAQTTVIDGVRTTLQSLRDELADALESEDTARIQAVVDKLDANTDALADAIADVPDEPTPEPTPEPAPEPEPTPEPAPEV